MKNEIIKFIRKNKFLLIFILLLFLVNFYIIFSIEKIQNVNMLQSSQDNQFTENQSQEIICSIEYSKPKCVNSSYIISFYNPNGFELHKIQIIVKKSDGTDIISINNPLAQNKTEILRLPECYEIDKVDIKWCCADICYQSPLTAYSEDLNLVK